MCETGKQIFVGQILTNILSLAVKEAAVISTALKWVNGTTYTLWR